MSSLTDKKRADRAIAAVLTKRLGGMRETIDVEARTATFVFSTNAVDRAGDIIDQASWQLDRYKTNPQFLWAHRSRELPIGMTVELMIKSDKLLGKVKFATAEENPFAEQCWQLVKNGYLSAVSVGFIPHRWESYDNGDGDRGYKLYDCELLECSLVPIPCNQDCRLVGRGFDEDLLRKGFTGVAQEYDESLEAVFSKDELEEAVTKAFEAVGTKEDHPEPEEDLSANGEAVYDSGGELMGIMVGGALKMTRLYQDKIRARNLAAISEQAGAQTTPATIEKQPGRVSRSYFLRNAKAASRRRRVALGM